MSFRTFLPHVALAVATLSITGCGSVPADLDLSLQHPSRHGAFVVRLEPPAAWPAINQMHSWQVRVSAPDGSPVTDARIGFDGGMPQHRHGFPTKPRVTREISPGVYLLEGMKFSMTGWWDMRLDVRAGEAGDVVAFNVIVDHAGLRR